MIWWSLKEAKQMAKWCLHSRDTKVGPDRTHQRMGGQAALFGLQKSCCLSNAQNKQQWGRDLKPHLGSPGVSRQTPAFLSKLSTSGAWTSTMRSPSETRSIRGVGSIPVERQGAGGHWLAAGHTNQGRAGRSFLQSYGCSELAAGQQPMIHDLSARRISLQAPGNREATAPSSETSLRQLAKSMEATDFMGFYQQQKWWL